MFGVKLNILCQCAVFRVRCMGTILRMPPTAPSTSKFYRKAKSVVIPARASHATSRGKSIFQRTSMVCSGCSPFEVELSIHYVALGAVTSGQMGVHVRSFGREKKVQMASYIHFVVYRGHTTPK